MKKAIITLTIGEAYQTEWCEHLRPGWEAYGRRHGYDILALDSPIDNSERAVQRSVHWQKLLILEHPRVAGYDAVVWVDADIAINAAKAPCIVKDSAADKVGVVSLNQVLCAPPARFDNRLARFYRYIGNKYGRVTAPTPAEWYAYAGLPGDVNEWTNTGVMVLRHAAHAGLLREVYERYEQNAFSIIENVPLSYHLFRTNSATIIDERFNCEYAWALLEHFPYLLLPAYAEDAQLRRLAVNSVWNNNWFVHFTGALGPLRRDYRLLIEGKEDFALFEALVTA